MKKIFALLCAAGLLGLTACGDTSEPPAVTTTTTAEETTTTAAEVTLSPETEEKIEVEDTQYIIENGVTDKMRELSLLVDGNRARLADKLGGGGELTVAYIGGSITQGSSADAQSCYARLTADWFSDKFGSVNYINAGIGATGSYIGVHRVESDVLAHAPDIVFVEFSVNDTTENTERNIAAYDSLIRKIWNSASAPAIITIATTQENGTSFQEYHKEIVEVYDIPMISYRNAILHVIEKGYIQWTDISDDDIHPNFTGHKVLAELVTAYLDDVLAGIDAVSGEESDLSTPFTADIYAGAELVRPGDARVLSLGAFEFKDENFGNFQGYWRLISEETEFAPGEGIVFEVEARNIALFVGMVTRAGGSFAVLVDGVEVAVVSTDFSGGWGNYVEAVEVYTSDTVAKHTVEILPIGNAEGAKTMFTLSSLAIS